MPPAELEASWAAKAAELVEQSAQQVASARGGGPILSTSPHVAVETPPGWAPPLVPCPPPPAVSWPAASSASVSAAAATALQPAPSSGAGDTAWSEASQLAGAAGGGGGAGTDFAWSQPSLPPVAVRRPPSHQQQQSQEEVAEQLPQQEQQQQPGAPSTPQGGQTGQPMSPDDPLSLAAKEAAAAAAEAILSPRVADDGGASALGEGVEGDDELYHQGGVCVSECKRSDRVALLCEPPVVKTIPFCTSSQRCVGLPGCLWLRFSPFVGCGSRP